ncbi:hypothetical protein Tco_0790603 [Tanacetum coccineum]
MSSFPLVAKIILAPEKKILGEVAKIPSGHREEIDYVALVLSVADSKVQPMRLVAFLTQLATTLDFGICVVELMS